MIDGLPPAAASGPSAGEAGPGPARPAWYKLHLWQIQPLRDAAIVLAVIGLFLLGKVLSVVTVPMLLALGLAYLFEPLVRRVTRGRAVSRQGAAMGIILAAGVAVVVPAMLMVGVAAVQGASYAQRIGANVQLVVARVEAPQDAAALAALAAPEKETYRRLADWLIRMRAELAEQRARARGGDASGPGEAPASPAPAAPAANGPSSAGAGPPATEPVPSTGAPSGEARPPAEPEAEAEADAANATQAPGEPDEPLHTIDAAELQLYRGVEWAMNWVRANAQTLGRTALTTGADALGLVLGWLTGAGMLLFGGFLTAFFFYFFCVGYGKVMRFWEGLIPERRKGRVVELLHQMDVVISGFIRGRLIICAILIIYYTVAYWAIGVSAWLLLGPVVGVLTLVPYAAGLGMPVAVALMWLEPPGSGWQATWWWMTLAPVGVNVAQQLLDDYVLTPRIQGRSTGMDTPTILFASLAGGVLAGFYGLLLAIPVAACVKILMRELVWPRVKAWAQGRAEDPLPIGDGDRRA